VLPGALHRAAAHRHNPRARVVRVVPPPGGALNALSMHACTPPASPPARGPRSSRSATHRRATQRRRATGATPGWRRQILRHAPRQRTTGQPCP
jgi:hypothetical protein